MKVVEYNLKEFELIEEFENVDIALRINSAIVDERENIIFYSHICSEYLEIFAGKGNVSISFKEELILSMKMNDQNIPKNIRISNMISSPPSQMNPLNNHSEEYYVDILYQKKKLFEESQGMSPDLVSIMTEEIKKGNPKALLNNQWCRSLNGTLYKKLQQIKNGENFDYDFSNVGTLPYSAIEIMNLNEQNENINHIIIVEVFYDPEGKDDNREWLILYNPTDDDIDICGWEIQVAGSYFKPSVTIGDAIIKSKSHFIIGGSLIDSHVDLECGLSMQNGGTCTDGVRIVNSNGIVQDTVLYNLNNSNALADDAKTPAISFAPDVNSGQSLLRRTIEGRYVDSNESAKDFQVNETPDISKYQ